MTNLPRHIQTVLLVHKLADLPRLHVAIRLGLIPTLLTRHISAHLLRLVPALLGRDRLAEGLATLIHTHRLMLNAALARGHVAALLVNNLLALPLRNGGTFLLVDVVADLLLGGGALGLADRSAGVLTDGAALPVSHLLALAIRDLLALAAGGGAALLFRGLCALLVGDLAALALVDHLAPPLCSSRTLLLLHRGALLLVLGLGHGLLHLPALLLGHLAALLLLLIPSLLLRDGLLNSVLDSAALFLLNCVALLNRLIPALLLIDGGALLPLLRRALLLRGGLALPLMNRAALLVGHILAHLLRHLLRHLDLHGGALLLLLLAALPLICQRTHLPRHQVSHRRERGFALSLTGRRAAPLGTFRALALGRLAALPLRFGAPDGHLLVPALGLRLVPALLLPHGLAGRTLLLALLPTFLGLEARSAQRAQNVGTQE